MIKIIFLFLFFAISSIAYSQTASDSLYIKFYTADRDYFLKLQETVATKNQYIGLQWCIDLLNKYIEFEEKKLKAINNEPK